jgi:FKBP-type peptidyl-prolyl cis-trans isomerase FkpA
LKATVIKGFAAALALAATMQACKPKDAKFVKFNNIIEYKHIKCGSGGSLSDSAILILRSSKIVGDTTIDKGTDEDAMMQPQLVVKPKDSQDINNILSKLRLGDSLVLRYNADSVFGPTPPPFYKKGAQVLQTLKVIKVFKSPTEYQAAQKKLADEAEAKEKATIEPDSKAIEAYAAKNGLTMQKTASGVYYAITKPGSGPNAEPGKELTMNYTGTTLDGAKFDSNTDPAFNHVSPFKFNLGMGMVIPGWDEGMTMFNKGSKGILLIPSALAYGSRGNAKIKPNTILRFDVEVVDITTPKAPKEMPMPMPQQAGK